ncbi:elongation factor G-like protein EF-G2 [Solicola gregarius]|uniref:Elongation factor G-like protein n=1 Tax=Solicola gregarius TaxID=2908642 RepID=A0AA46TGZ8_9ACTN|nr:elongation factor G-like protein EF-G2 [Solicola gregarius]UYM05013.1 elongation factor G-like protein EF-G2 [Solicola gregarius]
MSDKTTSSGGNPDLADFGPDRIRNVVLIGPSSSGKTTLVETLLAVGGAIPRAGSVADGTTVCDFDEAEHAHGRSMSLSVAPLVYEGTKVNLIDTPGYADFVGELRAGLRAADCALFVVAANEGIDHATTALWRECADVGMPRVVAITKLDHARADYDGVLAQAQAAFGEKVLPLFMPVAESGDLVGLVGLLSGRFYDHRGVGVRPVPLEDSPAAPQAAVEAELRGTLIEGVIEESEDETLMDRYLGGEEISEDALIDDLERAVARGSFYPVVATCASGIGCVELLDLLVRGFPPPATHPTPSLFTPAGVATDGLPCDPDTTLVAEVVKTTSDPYVGRVSLVRVFSGTLDGDETVHVSGHFSSFFGVDGGHAEHDEDERVGSLGHPFGKHQQPAKRVVAGDIALIGRLSRAETGDTLSHVDEPRLLRPWNMPTPLLPVALEAATKTDDDKLPEALTRLAAEDPSLRIENNPETRQLVLWSMGESHADECLNRLRNRFGVNVDQIDVRVPLRETFARRSTGHGRHVKQSGGHGQYAICEIEVEPLPGGSGFEFQESVVGGVVPRQFIPSVEKGVRAQMDKGVRSGHPLVDVRVTLTGGKAHSVDSSDAAFQTAGALALRDAAESAGVAILEPYDEIAVFIPDDLIGAVMSDLSSRRGRLLGTDKDDDDRTVVRAHVPATELVRYSIDLRSATHGTGTFTRTLDHYEPMPDDLAARYLG